MILLTLSYVLAVILVPYLEIPELLKGWGYLGMLTLGFMYVYTPTTGVATLTLLAIAGGYDLIPDGAITGLGALIGDLFLSYLMRRELGGELSGLAGEGPLRKIKDELPDPVKSEKFIIFLACVLIASPLPTEIGAAMLSLVRRLSTLRMALIMGSLHAAGISLLLILGTVIE